jgi:hypothetical protein
MNFLLHVIVMPAILDGGWSVGVSQTILKVGQLKIISAQISELILIWFFISHTVHNRYKLAEKNQRKSWKIYWSIHCYVTAFKDWAHFDL